jgi:hypothetical protein
MGLEKNFSSHNWHGDTELWCGDVMVQLIEDQSTRLAPDTGVCFGGPGVPDRRGNDSLPLCEMPGAKLCRPIGARLVIGNRL